MKYFKLFCITLLLLLLTSCQNFFSGSDDLSSSSKSARNYVSFTGNICLEGAYPQELVSNSLTTRTAFPALPANPVYRITASKNNTIVYDSTANDTDIQIAADKSSFTIKQLATGANWNITVAIYESSDTDFSAPLMSDSYPFTPSEENNVLTHDFELKPVLTGGKGRVLLTLSYPSGAFDDFSCSCLSSNSDKWIYQIDASLGNCVILSNTNGNNEIETGSYVLQFDFKKSGMLLYSDIQTINIFKNMQTSHWVNNGSSEAIQSDGTYVITQAMIDAFAQTQIFVGTNSWGTASSNGTGSRFAPFDTLQKAISYIETTGSSSKDYTIWVSGGSDENGGSIQGNTTLGDSLDGKSKSITIRGMHLDSEGNPLDKLIGYASKLNGEIDYKEINTDSTFETGEFAPVLTVVSENDYILKVTLQDICICEGAARNGAGLRTGGNHVTVTLNNVIISNNHASLYGGGVEVSSGAIVTFNSGKIKENSAYKSDSNSHGAGVSLNHAGSFIMNGGEISYNHAFESGGGVSLRSAGSTPTSNTFTLNSGKIISNYADAVVSGNKCGFAGAVHVYDGTFTMAGGEISGNHTNSDAGAISISGMSGKADTTAKFLMSGGIIKENYVEPPATPNTSAIQVSTVGTLQLSGNAYIPKTNTNHIIYLASGKKISIDSTLSPTSDGTATGSAESVAAVIHIADTYTENREILTGSNQTNVNSASGKVRMKNAGWCVSEGKLLNATIGTVEELRSILSSLDSNTSTTPYKILIADENPNFTTIKNAINSYGKYVNLSFPCATFTLMNNLNTSYIVGLTIPSSVTDIASLNAGFTSITIPGNVKRIGNGTFMECPNLTSVIIENGVEQISSHAFQRTNITTITIPASVTSIIDSTNTIAFYICRQLQEIIVDNDNQNYKSVDGVLYSKDGKTLYQYPPAKSGDNYVILAGTTEINRLAFSYSSLSKIEIPSGFETITRNALVDVNNLKTLILPASVTRLSEYALDTGCKVNTDENGRVYFRGTQQQLNSMTINTNAHFPAINSGKWVVNYTGD